MPDRENQAVALVYELPAFGRFVLIEGPTALTQAGLEGIAASCQSGCATTLAIEPLRDGTRAMLIDGEVSKGYMWIRNGVRFNLFGPADTFSITRARTVANMIANQR